jgi:uncharacterized protein DUF5060
MLGKTFHKTQGSLIRFSYIPLLINIFLVQLLFTAPGYGSDSLDQTGTQWSPYLEWSLTNKSYDGNPYDLTANVVFTHPSGKTITTGMFYAGNDTWKFRFTGVKTGKWSFTTKSDDPDLDGKTGIVTIKPNPDNKTHGFITNFGNKWGWTGVDKAFVPQLAMYENPPDFYQKPQKIDQDIQTFLVEHGFNGFHTMVFSRWFDINQDRTSGIKEKDPNPDPRTFKALELLITKTHAAGGMVHLWAWGDESRKMTPITWGKNGKVDQRLQRYIAARLGPIPGWSMGYGFDLFEWVVEKDLKDWRSYMHQHLGWFHFLGGRSGGPRRGTDHSKQQIYQGLDYSAYEHHRPTYEVYVAAIEALPGKPSFSEDRFRIRRPSKYPKKDYDEELTRKGLWHSAMAGGVANIWGNLINAPSVASVEYKNKHWIKTYSRFFENRFLKEMIRDNAISNGLVLRQPDYSHFIFFKENTKSIHLDLSRAKKPLPVIAVDAKKKYTEIDLGLLKPENQDWQAPYKSDWAIAVGDYNID